MRLTKEQCIDYLWKAIIAYKLPEKRGWPPPSRGIKAPKDTDWWDIGNSQGYYQVREDGTGITLELIDRGSDSLDDWTQNFSTFPFQLPKTKDPGNRWHVHAGFASVYLQKKDVTHELVRKFKPSKIVTTGHSLGGAICQLTALELKHSFPSIDVTCLPFSSPLLFKDKTAEEYNKTVNDTFGYYLQPDAIAVLPIDYTPVIGISKLAASEYTTVLLDSPLGQIISAVANEKTHPHHPLRLLVAMEKWL